MTEQSCKNCRFSRDDWGTLRCHRRAPTVIVPVYTNRENDVESNVVSAFPEVSEDTWCGEWEVQ